MIPYEILEHPADVGFRAWGSSPAELFQNAARALMAIAAPTPEAASYAEMAVVVTGHDWASMMVNWLEEILYLLDTGRFTPHDFAVDEITHERIAARLLGEPVRHPWKLIVKAITYHQIEVAERNGRWETRIFVDV